MRKSFAPHKEWTDSSEIFQTNLFRMDSLSSLPSDENAPKSKEYQDYLDKMDELSKADDKNHFDEKERKIGLNYYENILNKMLHAERHNIIGNKHTYFDYPSANMFYKVREKIEKTMSYRILQRLPKGGNLHIHTSSSWDAKEMLEFLKNDFKYKENVYVYQGETISAPDNKKPLFIKGQLLYLTDKKLISEFEKKGQNQNIKLVPISEINIEDEIKLITFSDPEIMSKVDYIWDEFSNVFARVYAILSVKEVYKEYYYHTFETLYADNIDYCELRFGITKFCESNNDKLDPENKKEANNFKTEKSETNEIDESIAVIYDIYKEFQKTHPDFKLKLIISTSRSSKPGDAVVKLMQDAQRWRESFKDDDGSDFIVGFDFVSEEDLNYKTDDYAEIILNNGINIPFYFHDGESNWADDDNVMAAVCLNTKRIGHGFNLYRFPAVLDEVVKKEICLEICPISNQLLRYSPDLRSHPMGEYIKRNVPFVICSDDPQIFNDMGLSYDFWEFYYSQLVDLISIKQAIRNSYTYSAMSESEKEKAIKNWETNWKKTIAEIVQNNTLGCAVMLEKYCDNKKDFFTLNEDDMNMWKNYYNKLLKDKNICRDLINENSSGTFSQEDCKAILKGIYTQLHEESITAQQTAEFENDLMQNMSAASISGDSAEISYEDCKTEYFNLAWK